MISIGRERVNLATLVAGAAANVVLNLLWIPRMGYLGAALGGGRVLPAAHTAPFTRSWGWGGGAMKLRRRVEPPDARPLVRADGRLLEGRVALVTGSSGLVGAAICEQAASGGARVVIGYHRRERETRALAERLSSSGAQAIALGADVRDQAEVGALVAAVVERFGRVDVLVNNASAMPAEVGMKGFLEHVWATTRRTSRRW